jgi:hypothetical protein
VCGKGGTLGETVGYLIALHVCMAGNPQEEDCGEQAKRCQCGLDLCDQGAMRLGFPFAVSDTQGISVVTENVDWWWWFAAAGPLVATAPTDGVGERHEEALQLCHVVGGGAEGFGLRVDALILVVANRTGS